MGITQSSLSANTAESHHSKTSIQKLSELHALDLSNRLVLEEKQWVKTEVSSLTVAFALGNLNENGTGAELNNSDS